MKHRNKGCGYLTSLGIAPFPAGEKKINSEWKWLIRVHDISLERSYVSNSKYIKPSVMRGGANLEYSNRNETFENSLEMPHH